MVDRSEHISLVDLVQSIVLIVLEALLTFLLKSDQESKKLAQNLIKQQALVELRTSLPSMVIFVTFTSRGVLLDAKKPARPIDAVISASFKDLLHSFMTAPASSLKKIDIDGPIELIDDLRVLMGSFNLQQIINHWIQSDWFKSLLLPTKDIDENGEPIAHHGRASSRHRQLLKKLNEQQILVDQMSLQAKENAFVIHQLNRQIKMLIVAGIVLMGCLIASLIGTLIYFLT
ncbi:hypothetical protein [Aquirhabdus sp.]|uniref:hypothetical protein n=1 Tax=Aquirhabdus sp. TaxID=2824160 RepID=UPI00396CD0BC